MSQDQPMQNRPVAVRQPIRIRLDQLKRSPKLNALGIPEIIALAGAALIVLITIVAYFYFLVPAQSRRTATQNERDLLQVQLRNTQGTLASKSGNEVSVDKVRASLEDFDSNWLESASKGRMTLYNELNNLIRSNGLRNTAGPSYSPLQPLGTKNAVQATAAASQQTKWQTVYPGIAVSVTVEGPYQNVRHFVRDIEISREFLIINAVELESVTHTTGIVETPPVVTGRTSGPRPSAVAPPPVQTPGEKGSVVSLRVDLATYFRRPGTEADSPRE